MFWNTNKNKRFALNRINKRFDKVFKSHCGGEFCKEETCKGCGWLGDLGEVYNIVELEMNNKGLK